MTITTLSSSEFLQDVCKAKQAAERGPVFITSDESTTHVLLTYHEYKKLSRRNKSMSELLAMPGVADIELELPFRRDLPPEADLSQW